MIVKRVGIVGGIAPESTIQYYRSIVAMFRERTGHKSYPPILINSIDMTKMLDLIGRGQMEEVSDYLLGEIDQLARGGADFALLASNTPHIVFDRIESRTPIPLISIVEAARDAVLSAGGRKVGLFGTRFTMQGGFYREVMAQSGITVVTPSEIDQTFIHEKYMSELVAGQFLNETRGRLLSIVDSIRQTDQIEGLILGGTELPLILRPEDEPGIRFFDTTRIHAERAVDVMLAKSS